MTNSIPWWTPTLTGDEYDRVRAVLDSVYLNDGKITAEFEERVAGFLGVRYAVAVTSGTAAIFLALKAAGIGPGDEVIVPDLTFIATANAAHLTGARVVLVDVDAQTLNVDPVAIESAITSRSRAIVPVHVSGRAADIESIIRIAGRHSLAIIEDAAEGFGSRRGRQYLGTIGIAGCFSFSPNKTITTGQGGMVVTNDDTIRRHLRELKDQGRPVQGTGGDDIHFSIGYNFKLTNLQAAVGLGQMSALDERLERARRIYRWYSEGLADVDGVRLPGFDIDAGETPQWTDAVVDRRDDVDQYLTERGIQCRRFWHPIHSQQPYRRADAEFPQSTSIARAALWLPSSFQLTREDAERVCHNIRECLRE